MASQGCHDKLKRRRLRMHAILLSRTPRDETRPSMADQDSSGRDPPLNATGEEQVKKLAEEMKPQLSEFDLIVTSPLTRAMQTATGGFAGCNAPFMVNALLRERMGAPCDTGRTKSELLLSFPRMVRWAGIDELEEVWWSESWIEWDLLSRVEELEDWISARPEKTIAVVGHGGLFSRFLGHHLKNCGHQWVDWVPPTSSSSEDLL
eukprot:CAMPEP_0181244780 /NCGR_PEP_ID=MMETSP1096-20121128/43054_1 /TAXON_ID=156174 ORGANISM="Chrysochromulina ericina, Strain CCMP281" /NCGR_SAMPLE_ID=MMETSP1096 /ASSEMBLY_ACC=CAM_ASM_000453 /LENGTH=205 /DNA_ID=CAMNT_0023341375 /DNA_START=667 /DNA_END=1285 /DNA_ORIENTATION=+